MGSRGRTPLCDPSRPTGRTRARIGEWPNEPENKRLFFHWTNTSAGRSRGPVPKTDPTKSSLLERESHLAFFHWRNSWLLDNRRQLHWLKQPTLSVRSSL